MWIPKPGKVHVWFPLLGIILSRYVFFLNIKNITSSLFSLFTGFLKFKKLSITGDITKTGAGTQTSGHLVHNIRIFVVRHSIDP